MDQQHIEQILSKMEFEMKVAIKSEQMDHLLQALRSQSKPILQDYLRALVVDSPLLKPWYERALEEIGAQNEQSHFSNEAQQQLTNEYFDTPQDELFSKFSAGLRLRRSSRFSGVEQTIKLKGAEEGATHSHLEFNVRTEQDLQVPDLSLFASGSLPDDLNNQQIQSQLHGKYKTDFKRITADLDLPYIGKVELALDQGEVSAQGLSSGICEMELELKSLDPQCFGLPAVVPLDADMAKVLASVQASVKSSAKTATQTSAQVAAQTSAQAAPKTVALDDFEADTPSDFFDESAGKVTSFQVYDLDDLKLFLVHNTIAFVTKLNQRLLSLQHNVEFANEAIFGLEPFSKLKRAVLLKMYADLTSFKIAHPEYADLLSIHPDILTQAQAQAQAKHTEQAARMAQLPEHIQAALKALRVNFKYRATLEKLRHQGEYDPSILDYVSCGESIMLTFFDACGKVKLFGSTESLQDLQAVLHDCADFVKDSWFFKDESAGWQEELGMCSLFYRQSFWGGLAKRFMGLVEELGFHVNSLLEEQNAPESSYGNGTLPYSELFYDKSSSLALELPFLVHFTSYCCKRYQLLLQLKSEPAKFKEVVAATSAQLSYLLPEDVARHLMSASCDTDDMQCLFEVRS